MKKQLLVFSLAGLFALTACGQSKPISRELTPVDDATGLQRATKILEAETTALSAAHGDPKKFFDILPKTFTFNFKRVINGKARIMNMESQPLFIVDSIYDNCVQNEAIFEVNCNTLQLHSYTSSLISDSYQTEENNFFYDEANSLIYLLTNTNGVKTKMSLPAPDFATAEATFYNVFAQMATVTGVIEIILPVNYLATITSEEEDKNMLLEAFNGIQKDYFDRFGNDDEYFKYQFGSDDESSLSIKNDLIISLNTIPMMNEEGSYISVIANGYATGDGSARYNQYIQPYFESVLDFSGLGAPDLIVFKNNYLSYFTSTEKVDVESVAQLGISAGALYQHTARDTTMEMTENANIVNPNPDEYEPQ